MKKSKFSWFTLLSISAILGINACKPSSPEQLAQHVIVIGVDGMSPDGIANANTPVMDTMIAQGSSSMFVRAVMPSSSGANWGSIIMGAGPEQHGIISNEWKTNNSQLHPTVTRNENLFPTVFAVIRDQRPDAEIGAILNWNPISNFIEEDVTDFMSLPENEDETTRQAVDYIKRENPDFTFIHIDHVDGTGHTYGHGTEQYYKAVSKADSLIGEIKRATEEEGIAEETLIIITSDHGGIGLGHGGLTPDEMEIPLILYGKNIKEGHILNFPINTYDNPATVLFALGLNIPFEWIGRPVKAAFSGYDDPDLMYNFNSLIQAPQILPAGEGGFNPAGGLFVDETPALGFERNNINYPIRYTTDGSEPTAEDPIFDKEIEIDENTIVKSAYFQDGEIVSQVSTGYFRLVDDTTDHGVSYSLYKIAEDSDFLPDFNTLSPIDTGIVLEISTNDLIISTENYIGAVFEGFIEIPIAGNYTFSLASDDGSKLFINDLLVVDNDGDHGVISRSGSIQLPEGIHRIRTEWFNGGGGYWLGTYIQGPDLPKQIIPSSMISPL